jgi:hypothetical protein
MKEKIKTFFARWWVLVALLILMPLLWPVALVVAQSTDIPDSNFFKMWLASHLVWTGGDPYSPVDWLNGHLAFHSTWIPEKAYLYPLPLAYLLSPLGLMMPLQAYKIWVFLSLLGFVMATFILVNQWEESKLKPFSLLLIVFFFFFAPVIQTVGKGTLGAFLLVGAACACELLKRQKPFWGGMFFAILLLKPQLGVPILTFMSLWMLFRRDWRALAGLAAGGALLFLIGELGDLYWLTRFLSVSQQKFGLSFGFQPTVFSMASLICNHQQTCTVGLGSALSLGLAACITHLFFLKAKEFSAVAAFGVAAPVGMLITPYLWSYDHILLLIPLIWLTYHWIVRTKKFVFAVLFLLIMDVLAGVGFFLQGLRPEKDFWNFVIPLCVMGLALFFILRPLPKVDEQG